MKQDISLWTFYKYSIAESCDNYNSQLLGEEKLLLKKEREYMTGLDKSA